MLFSGLFQPLDLQHRAMYRKGAGARDLRARASMLHRSCTGKQSAAVTTDAIRDRDREIE